MQSEFQDIQGYSVSNNNKNKMKAKINFKKNINIGSKQSHTQ